MVAAILGSTLFLIIAPGTVAVYVPFLLTQWHVAAPLLGIPILRVFGILMIAAGLLVLLDSFVRFAVQGIGTPAPIFPTQRLVVTGLYRYVRNPMYVAVVSLIFGQGFLFGSPATLVYGGIVWVIVHAFVLTYEEPTLAARYGREYEEFCSHVPRWIPRLAKWQK